MLDDDGAELLPERELEYDTLIIAIGSTTAFFGVQGAPEFSLALDTVSQAERLPQTPDRGMHARRASSA